MWKARTIPRPPTPPRYHRLWSACVWQRLFVGDRSRITVPMFRSAGDTTLPTDLVILTLSHREAEGSAVVDRWSEARFSAVIPTIRSHSRERQKTVIGPPLYQFSDRCHEIADCQIMTSGLRDFPPKMVRFQILDQTEYCNTAMECGGSSRCGVSGLHGITWGTTRAGWATSL